MKSQSKSQSLRPGINNRDNDAAQCSAVYRPKPLLKASTNLPPTPSQDDTGCFIKGYN